ncbi:MAG: hypothetical protein KTR20_04535 [Cellvibrionaceae bacterium]|nr:hypothetical protein [Cellvibrionaceae bacterium]
MSNEEHKDNKGSKNKKTYHQQFIPTDENLQKIEKAFDKSRALSMKGKFDGYVEVK